MRWVLSSLLMLALVAIGAAGIGRGASTPAPAPPWVVDGDVSALAVADGKLFVGGEFKQVAAPTGPLVALTSAGVHDAAFPGADLNGHIRVAIGDGHGGLFVGGSFNTLGGVACGSLAHIRRDGTVDARFCPRPNGYVDALSLARSRLYVGGEFDRIAGVKRKALAAIDLSTGRVTAFRNANPPDSIRQLDATPDAIYALGAGTFIALNPVTGKRLRFAPNATPPNSQGETMKGFALAGRRVYAWGYFGRIGGKRCVGLAILDARTGTAVGCKPDLEVSAGLVADRVLYIGAWVAAANGQPRPELVALDADTGRRLPWRTPGLPAGVSTLAVAGGVLYAAGPTSTASDAGSVITARWVRTGAPVSFSTPGFNGWVNTIAVVGDRVVVGGVFRSLGGTYANLLAIDAASGRPLAWQAGIRDDPVDQLSAVGSTVYVAGYFDRAAGQPRGNFAAFDARSGRLLPWQPQIGYVAGLAATPKAVYTALNPINEQQLFELDPRTGAVRGTLRMPTGTDTIAATGDIVFDATTGERLVAVERTPLRVAAKLDLAVPLGSVSQALVADGRSVYMGGTYTRLAGIDQRYLARVRLESGALRVDRWRPRLPGPVDALALDGTTLVVAGLTPDETRWYVALVDTKSGKTRTLGYGSADGPDAVKAVAMSGHAIYVGGTIGLQRFQR